MPCQRQDECCGQHEGNREAADQQDQAETKGLGPRFYRGLDRPPLLWRLRRHADQHCRFRRSDRPGGRIVVRRCYVHECWDLLPWTGGAFLDRAASLLAQGGRHASAYLADGSDSLPRAQARVQCACAQAVGSLCAPSGSGCLKPTMNVSSVQLGFWSCSSSFAAWGAFSCLPLATARSCSSLRCLQPGCSGRLRSSGRCRLCRPVRTGST
jgi:hypothetical protein